jgi:hypothetical protein
MRGITALQARAVHLNQDALQAGTALRALIPAKEPDRARRAGTALWALIPAKEPGRAMRGFTALQARAVQLNGHALQAGTALRALIPAKEPDRAMRAGTAIGAPLQPWGLGFAMRGITAMQARAVYIKYHAL